MQSILVCDDDKQIVEAIDIYLTGEGFEVIKAYDGAEALELLKTHTVNLMILDVMMPGLDGIRTTLKVRETSSIPIIILSAKSEDADKILGLNIGADDYITKPFSVEEMLARIRAAIRRLGALQPVQEAAVFVDGDLRIDYTAGCAYVRGEEVHLTPIEYKLLVLLAKNAGRVLTHAYILKEVWGSALPSDVASLRVFMVTLRKKLETGQEARPYIQTHVGIGYRLIRYE